jgi:hypothetical protein
MIASGRTHDNACKIPAPCLSPPTVPLAQCCGALAQHDASATAPPSVLPSSRHSLCARSPCQHQQSLFTACRQVPHRHQRAPACCMGSNWRRRRGPRCAARCFALRNAPLHADAAKRPVRRRARALRSCCGGLRPSRIGVSGAKRSVPLRPPLLQCRSASCCTCTRVAARAPRKVRGNERCLAATQRGHHVAVDQRAAARRWPLRDCSRRRATPTPVARQHGLARQQRACDVCARCRSRRDA